MSLACLLSEARIRQPRATTGRLHCISRRNWERLTSLACLLSAARIRQPRATTGRHHCISRRDRETLTRLACLFSEARHRHPRTTTGDLTSTPPHSLTLQSSLAYL